MPIEIISFQKQYCTCNLVARVDFTLHALKSKAKVAVSFFYLYRLRKRKEVTTIAILERKADYF